LLTLFTESFLYLLCGLTGCIWRFVYGCAATRLRGAGGGRRPPGDVRLAGAALDRTSITRLTANEKKKKKKRRKNKMKEKTNMRIRKGT